MPPTDPLIYRFYELVMINGPAWKALIEEEYGDGISAGIVGAATDEGSCHRACQQDRTDGLGDDGQG